MASIVVPTGGTEPRWMTELLEHLEPLLESARRIDNKRKDFHNSYRTWLRVNKEAIDSTTEIRDEIIATNRNNNYYAVGGAAGGTAGSIMAIIGAVAAIPTGGASLIVTGGVIATFGTALTVGSDMRRNAKIKKLCKTAVSNLEKNRKDTDSFDKECQSYFDDLDTFKSFFKTISGNDVALSLFYEASDEEGFDFLDDLRLDRWSRNKLRSALEEIIESDVTKLVPRMWSLEFMKNAQGKVKSLSQKIRNMLNELKKIIDRDPYLSGIMREKMRKFLITKLEDIRQPEVRQIIKALSTLVAGTSIGSILSGSFLNIRISLKEISNASRVALVALNVVFVVVGIIGITKALINLENDSQSDESKNITEAINDLKEVRKTVVEEMGKNFGW